MLVPISDIKISPDRIPIQKPTVSKLANSIQKIGLLNPPTITEDLTLIAGHHRIEACKELGWKDIEVNIVSLDGLLAELAEIDENLIRNNHFHYVIHSEQLAKRKEIYEALYPEAKKGVSQALGMNKAQGNNVSAASAPTFVQDTAQKTGVSTRVIHEEIQIANNLTPEAKEAIIENDIPKSEAVKISRLEPEEQRPKVIEIAKIRKAAIENTKQQENKQIDADYDALRTFTKIISYSDLYLIDDDMIATVARIDPDFPQTIKDLDRFIQLLTTIKNKLITERGNRND